MSSFDLDSAIVPVTGAASGIGLAVCRRLRAAGATPLLLDVDESRLPAALEQVYGSGHGEASRFGYRLDVRDAAAVDACLDHIRAEHGPITHAVSNAGRSLAAHILEMSDAQWHDILGINLHGTMYFCRAAARQLVARGKGGAIVNIASIAGFQAKENRAAYVSSKAAVVNLTRSLALDLGGHGIRVNGVAPGIIDTPIQMSPTFREDTERRAALKRVGSADEIAKVVLFLLSDLASYVTGETVVADGGITARYN
jgi:3-oxoacyl-[acyl-carrier protein] reductase